MIFRKEKSYPRPQHNLAYKKFWGLTLIALILTGCQFNLFSNPTEENILENQPQPEIVIENASLSPNPTVDSSTEETLTIEKPTLNILPEYQNQAIFSPLSASNFPPCASSPPPV